MPSNSVSPPPREAWLLKAIVSGLVFSLIVALASTVLGPPLAARFAESFRESNCADPRGLTRVSPIGVEASSELKPETTSDGRSLTYEAERAIDGDTGTAWVEGAAGLGQGEWIQFEFQDPQEVRLLCVVNGYALTWDLYNKNPRVRAFTLGFEEDTVGETLSDNATENRFAYFQEVRGAEALLPSRTLRLTITGLYAGIGRQRYSDSSLSEIEFWVSQDAS